MAIGKCPLEPLSLGCRPAEEQVVDWVLVEMLGQECRTPREVTVCQPDLAPIDMSTGRRPLGGGVAARGRRAADIPPVLPVSVWSTALKQRWIFEELAETVFKHAHLLVIDAGHAISLCLGQDGLQLQEMRVMRHDDLVLHPDWQLDRAKPQVQWAGNQHEPSGARSLELIVEPPLEHADAVRDQRLELRLLDLGALARLVRQYCERAQVVCWTRPVSTVHIQIARGDDRSAMSVGEIADRPRESAA
jgi:hypothetical protein